jgi:hypothetical protein
MHSKQSRCRPGWTSTPTPRLREVPAAHAEGPRQGRPGPAPSCTQAAATSGDACFFFFFESYTQQTGVQLGPEGHGMETATWITRTENHTELARTRGGGAGAGRHERLDARERGAQPQRVQSSGREVSVEVQRQKRRRERGRRRQPTAGRKTIGRKKEGKGEAPPANGREEDHTVRATGEAGGGGGGKTHTHTSASAPREEKAHNQQGATSPIPTRNSSPLPSPARGGKTAVIRVAGGQDPTAPAVRHKAQTHHRRSTRDGRRRPGARGAPRNVCRRRR